MLYISILINIKQWCNDKLGMFDKISDVNESGHKWRLTSTTVAGLESNEFGMKRLEGSYFN